MNIQEAKEEVIRTVRAYTAKNEQGEYCIPVQKQRPLLLIGPPGIGKTAIMEQAAQECGVNLVSYTITHHTRQSAIGLPFIAHQNFGGKEMTVTEYSMSEIIASVYEQIEKSGVKDGILFLDEINCVSETLAPTMLQFLQYKTFGAHHLPEGFVIVTAGNPPQYNKSVRDFDIVTLDRIRKIEVTQDLDVWKKYARKAGVHGAVMAYLEIRSDRFYSIRTDVENRFFVTARGWEDLSRVMKLYEELGFPVTENLIGEYLQDPEIAQDFSTYYELYCRYRDVYRVPEILEGVYREELMSVQNSPFDEKLSLIGLLVDALSDEFSRYVLDKEEQIQLLSLLKNIPSALQSGETVRKVLQRIEQDKRGELARKEEAKMITPQDAHVLRRILQRLDEVQKEVAAGASGNAREDFSLVQAWFAGQESGRQERIQKTSAHTTHAFEFIAKCFGEGQEMVIFLSELSENAAALQFVNENGNDAYFKYNRLLLLDERRSELTQEIMQLMPS